MAKKYISRVNFQLFKSNINYKVKEFTVFITNRFCQFFSKQRYFKTMLNSTS